MVSIDSLHTDPDSTAESKPYGRDFFEANLESWRHSARVIIPKIIELVSPHSVVDVGCGIGIWLSVFAENGVKNLRGLDGDYIDRSRVLIDPVRFDATDLSRPFKIDGKYDLAVCVEVAEHLPGSNAGSLIDTLTSAAPIVLFSAAPPGEGGVEHINEQWPTYWRQLFAERGYRMLDPIRPTVRDDCSIAWWYRQNVVIFADDAGIRSHPRLAQFQVNEYGCGTEWIHIDPYMDMYRKLQIASNLGLHQLAREFPIALKRAVLRRLKTMFKRS